VTYDVHFIFFPRLKRYIADQHLPMKLQSVQSTILHGRWLRFVRAAWLVVGALAVGLFVAGIPAEYRQLQRGCPTVACASSGGIAPVELSLLEKYGISPEFFATYGIALELVFALAFVGVAALIFWRKSSDRLALFVSFALLLFGTATQPYAMHALVATQHAWRPLVDSLHFLGSASFSLLLFIFPDGRFVPRWTRWVALVWSAWLLPRYWFPDWPPSGSNTWLAWPNLIVWLGALGGAVYSQAYRYRHVSNAVQRQQTKWVVFGIAIGLALFVIVNIVVSATVPVPTPASDLTILMAGAALMNGALLLIPLSIGIAVLRYHLFDIDILINRTLVYGALTVSVVGIYVFVVGYLGTLFQTRNNLAISLIATGLVAVVFQPLRQRLQRGINHLMYGERDDPYAALTRLGRRLEATLAPGAVLPTIVTTIREVLKLPYVAIYLKQDRDDNKIVAESASSSLRAEGGKIRVPGMEQEGLCIPLIHQGETLGHLVLGPRAPNEAFSSTDLRLLNDLALQVGVAVHAVRLTADLQRSREQLVLAREEERRRLRRDLHDDLGPTLASLGLTASTAADLISTNPTTATKLVKELQIEIRATVGNIRSLVYDLRPPTLDELGLLAAIRERAAQYSNAPDGFHVSVEAPVELPALPAAVEVAAYRIVQEALENVSKHSQARQCTIRFSNHGRLEIEIMDDGIGLPPNITPGVGLRSMRERAEELGGVCMIERHTNGGTRILAHLPIGGFDGSITHPDRG
jgi:signal transduction histidine kinase